MQATLSKPEATTSEAILERLVGFDTTSRNSNLALIEWVETYLAAHGVASELVYDATGAKANLFATIGAGENGIILSGHTDVVPVDGQEWASDPFSLTERDGRLYGRGTADMKGFLAVCLAKVPAMAAAALARPLHLAFSYDEEVGCLGVQTLIAALNDRGARFEACFVGEPTKMQVVTAHKAKRSHRARFTGLPCHSALAPNGVNAISHAARLVARIDAIAEELAAGPSDPLFDMPVSTAQVGVFNGGTALNIVPQEATVDYEFRLLPSEDIDSLAHSVERYLHDEVEPEMKGKDARCGVTVELLSAIPGLDTPADAPVTALAKRLARRNDHAKVAFGTEGGRFSDDLGVPTVVVGPGSIGEAHKADEFIEIAELRKCEAFIDDLITHMQRPS